MQTPEDTHWLEAGLAALIAALGWCWRLAVKDHDRHRRIERLEQWREAHMREYRAVADTLSALQQGQAVQNESLKNICRSLDELRETQREIIAYRMTGGRRSYDPPAPGGEP